MIQCENCLEWFHTSCVAVDADPDLEYACESCAALAAWRTQQDRDRRRLNRGGSNPSMKPSVGAITSLLKACESALADLRDENVSNASREPDDESESDGDEKASDVAADTAMRFTQSQGGVSGSPGRGETIVSFGRKNTQGPRPADCT